MLGIYDSANVWIGNVENIATIIIDYYQDLFTTTNPDLSSSVLDQIPFVITASMNNHLNGTFYASKVAYALKKMGPLKVPRPNGMSPLFFQHYWPIVEGDITQSVLAWLNLGT